jgi:hypothetical protein
VHALVGKSVRHVGAHHLADEQVAAADAPGPEPHHLQRPALEAERALGDARRAHGRSLSPWASGSAHATTRSTFDSVATLTVNSPVPPSAAGFALRSVSFSPWPPGGFATHTTSVIGSLPPPVKKLKGARFGRPSASQVPTTAMGRGTIAPIIRL